MIYGQTNFQVGLNIDYDNICKFINSLNIILYIPYFVLQAVAIGDLTWHTNEITQHACVLQQRTTRIWMQLEILLEVNWCLAMSCIYLLKILIFLINKINKNFLWHGNNEIFWHFIRKTRFVFLLGRSLIFRTLPLLYVKTTFQNNFSRSSDPLFCLDFCYFHVRVIFTQQHFSCMGFLFPMQPIRIGVAYS